MGMLRATAGPQGCALVQRDLHCTLMCSARLKHVKIKSARSASVLYVSTVCSLLCAAAKQKTCLSTYSGPSVQGHAGVRKCTVFSGWQVRALQAVRRWCFGMGSGKLCSLH